MILKALLIGAFLPLPVIFTERMLALPAGNMSFYPQIAWTSFVVAGFTEEGFKFLAFLLIIWRNIHFNEKFDGIVYAVFISMGFAGVENILYVYRGGNEVALARALTAVPAHALFGVVMGYYLGLARFYLLKRKEYMMKALVYPLLLHGFYDFVLLSQYHLLLLFFVPYMIWLWVGGSKKIRALSEASFYRNDLF